MKLKLIFFLSVLFGFGFSQADTSHIIKVHFLYGSKPRHKYRATEYKAFGGIHGGHVSIQVDDTDYGFEPAASRAHIFPHKKYKSAFVARPLNGSDRYSGESKTVTFILPISSKQYEGILQIHQNYCHIAPFDYAFFGMRCASATQQILGETGIVKKKKRFANIVTTFYPKKLRKRLFKLAAKNNYKVIKNEGRETRKWERD